MDFYAFSGLLNGLAATISGLIVYAKQPRDPKHQAYALYCLTAAVWGYGYWAWQISSSPDLALFFIRLLMVGAIFLPVAYLWHVLTLLEQVQKKKVLIRLGWGAGGFFFCMNFTSYFVAGVRPLHDFPFWPVPGPVFHVYLLTFSMYAIYGTWLLYQGARSKTGNERSRFYLLTIGSIIAYIGGMTSFPLWYGIDVLPNGTILVTVYTSVVAYTLLRYRLLDLGTAVERSITGALLLALVAFPAYPILLLGQNLYLGHMNIPYSFVELGVLLILVLAASSLKREAEIFITKSLFKERYIRHETVVQFSKSLVSILELKELTATIVEFICPALGLQWGVLYLRSASSQDYRPISTFGKAASVLPVLHWNKAPALAALWRPETSCMIIKELDASAKTSESHMVITQLAEIGAEVCLPLVNKNRLLGFCVFGPNIKSGGGYTTQALDLLSMLSQEASVALDNALLYEELKRSQSLVRRTDRLRSLETMAGGLAHEIRNPLTSIKAFVDLAPERKDDEQFLVRFSKVVKEDVFRIERLTREILDYAKPMEPFLKEEDLNEIVESCLYTLRIRPSHELLVIETDLAGGLPQVFADRQQLKQVLLNVFFNAMEAMLPAGGVLTVRTRIFASDQAEEWIQVEVQDTGKGIEPEDIEHIFDPFFTTKHLSQEHEGTGLGLAIAHQIIQEHHGSIEVQSVPKRGTVFFINLPSCHSHPPPPVLHHPPSFPNPEHQLPPLV